jgi:succinoglycan biosynthesis protein ExoU
VAVLIAARDAATTIGDAVASALAEPQAAEVIVIDDASHDQTGAAAELAARGDTRLKVLRPGRNLGPAAARNLALGATRAPVIAVLDADDVFLPGRLSRLMARDGWDLIADNILFLPEDSFELAADAASADLDGLSALDLAGFVAGNLQGKGQARGELGFLKPLIRREFLEKHGLHYDAGMRLGEDYDLYVRALVHGARFLVSHRPGYAARVREGSLSGRHATADLEALAAAASKHVGLVSGHHAARPALERLAAQVRARLVLRQFLDRKAEAGLGAALALAIAPPSNLGPIARGVLRDKLASRRPAPPPAPRYLLPALSPSRA